MVFSFVDTGTIRLTRHVLGLHYYTSTTIYYFSGFVDNVRFDLISSASWYRNEESVISYPVVHVILDGKYVLFLRGKIKYIDIY